MADKTECPECGENKDPKFETCFSCSPIEVCDCGSGFYNSAKFDECRSCRTYRKARREA